MKELSTVGEKHTSKEKKKKKEKKTESIFDRM